MNPAHARLLSQLAAATERFLSDVAALPDLNRQPDAGGWSATQVIRHLMGSEAGITALLAKQAHKAPSQLPRAGLRSWLLSRYMSWAFARPNRRFPAPARLGEPLADPTAIEALRAQWQAQRESLRTVLESWPAGLQGRAVFQHPRAGWLTLEQTLRFMIDHVGHHRHQIARLSQ